MSHLGRRLLMAASGSGSIPSFNPITGVGWSACYYAEGPEFAALGYADTNAVGTWPDEIGTANMTQATAGDKPVYSAAGFTGLPSVSFVSTDVLTGTPVCTLPRTYVAIGKFDSLADTGGLIGGNSTSYRYVAMTASPLDYSLRSGGTASNGGTPDTSPHFFRAYIASGSTDTLSVDETTVLGPSNAGDTVHTELRFGRFAGNSVQCQLAFVGIYAGDVTADGGWAAFKTWAGTKYGLTIA